MTPVSQQRWTGHWIVTRYAIKRPCVQLHWADGQCALPYTSHFAYTPPTASKATITEKLASTSSQYLFNIPGKEPTFSASIVLDVAILTIGQRRINVNANLQFSRVEGIVESGGSTQLSLPSAARPGVTRCK